MTFPPVPMTMPSVDCPAPYPSPRALVRDRFKQRFQRYGLHDQSCRDRYNVAQRIIRPNEKRDTALLLQRVQEYKNKKGVKFKADSSRQKSTQESNDASESSYSTLALSRLKQKLQLGGEGSDGHGTNNGYGESSGNDPQDPKKAKHDLSNMQNGQRQDYPLQSVSVHIVQNCGNEASKRTETTVNVHSSRDQSDSQSISVNVGSKNVKQEMHNDSRQQQMNHGNMNRSNANEASDLGGFSEEDFMTENGDLDLKMLYELCQQFPEDVMDELGRALMTPESQSQQMTSQSQHMTSQSQHMTSQPQQQMASQSQRMTSQSQQMTSQPQQMSSPQQHMSSPGQHMTSPPGHMTSQPHSNQMQQQSARMLCKSEKVEMFQGFHGNTSEKNNDAVGLTRNPRSMNQQIIPPSNMTQQNIPASGMSQQNLPGNSMTQQNMSANIMTQQSMRVGQNNFAAQQNISLNMSSTRPPTHRLNNNQTTNNNNNMTSQHIHRLNQVTVNSQFSPHDAPVEPPRLFHPPANTQGPPSQMSYESHSQQLKQLAEKRWEMNSSASVNMTSDIRTSQNFPQYRNGEVPPMSQPRSLPSHPMSGSQRLSHLDPNIYNRPNQQFPPNQRSGSVNMMMQQSMTSQLQHEAIMKQRASQQYQMQNSQSNYHIRQQDPHQQHAALPPSNPINPFHNYGAGHPSWNTRAPSWPGGPPGPPQNPMQRSDIPQSGYLPELDLQTNVDLNILDEILSR